MQDIPGDNLSYPALIVFDTGSSGSSFFLKYNGKNYLITAKHVLFNADGELRGDSMSVTSQPRDESDDSKNIFSVNLSEARIFSHLSEDVAAIEWGVLEKTNVKNQHMVNHCRGVNVKQKTLSGTVSVPKIYTKLLDEVLIANSVFLSGYPNSLGLQQSPQFDYEKPLLRKGIIANKNPKMSTLILDCPVYYGNSGGPVVQVEDVGHQIEYRVIGVVSQFIPFVEVWENKQNGLKNETASNSGYSVAVSMDKVFELIDTGGMEHRELKNDKECQVKKRGV
jgi:V8-like Glu-specific endopeptidase